MTMKAELSALKPSELSKRAATQGVAQADIDRAVDGDSPKELLIDLMIRHAAATAKSKTKNKKARRSKEDGLSKGQACCVVSCTVLALAAMCGSLCMFSVRRVLRSSRWLAHRTDLHAHFAGRVLQDVRTIGCGRRWHRRLNVPSALRWRRCTGPYIRNLCSRSWRHNTVWANDHSRILCAVVRPLQTTRAGVDPVCGRCRA